MFSRFKMGLASVLIVLLCLVTGATADDTLKPLKWAILIDLSRSNMTLDSFNTSLHTFRSKMLGTGAGATLFANEPIILNSDGNLITALTVVTDTLNHPDTIPDVLFLAETADVSLSVVDVMKKYAVAESVLYVSVHSSNANICDPDRNPRMVCMVPRDMLNVRALLEVASSQLKWDSMSMVFNNNEYGLGVQSTVGGQVQAASTTPTIVSQVFMDPHSDDASDDEMVRTMMKSKPVGIAAFLREAQMRRLRDALVRTNHSNTFIIGSREALNLMSSLTAVIAHKAIVSGPWGAVFASAYTSVSSLLAKGYFTSTLTIDDFGAFIVSHLFDGMTMIEQAGGISSMAALRATTFDGFTGTVAFDTVYYQRVEMEFSLMTADFPIGDALVTWYLQSYSSTSVITNPAPASTAAMVPLSPLMSVTVCMTSPATCSDTQMMVAMLYVLLEYNAATELNSSAVSFLPVAINTGNSGVNGLSSLIPIARTCTVLTGPGNAQVTLALTPVINEFKITQLDYNSANDFFTSDEYAYPYFSRTTPANSFIYGAYGQVLMHYAWERVVIIAANDQLGNSRAQAMQTAMRQQNIYVEKVYLLDDTDKASLKACFDAIYSTAVTRIIIVLLALSGDSAAMFYALPGELTYLNKYIFFLSNQLCSYGYNTPSARAALPSSICLTPYVPPDRLTAINKEFSESPSVLAEIKSTMSDGGFVAQVETCNISTITPRAGFAVDAGYVLVSAVERALAAKVVLSQSANLKPFVRGTSIDKFTGAFTISAANGNRDFAAYTVDIEVPGTGVLEVGTWSEKQVPRFRTTQDDFLWLTGSKDVPLDTFRDMSFVLNTTVSASPGAIVLSVLGFVATIGVFVFCYRHYKVQKLIEITLQGSEVPVTEEELKRLRGEREDA